jgi:anti-sigma B factor antagonist
VDFSASILEIQPGCQVLKAKGEIDLESVGQFEDCAEKVMKTGPKAVLVDLSGVSYMGSCGIRILLLLNTFLARSGNKLVIVGATGGVLATLELVGFPEMLHMAQNVEEGLKLLTARRSRRKMRGA